MKDNERHADYKLFPCLAVDLWVVFRSARAISQGERGKTWMIFVLLPFAIAMVMFEADRLIDFHSWVIE